MAIYKRGGFYWYEFIFAGKRVRESAKTTSRTQAREAERRRRRELEQVLTGVPVEQRRERIRSVADATKAYLESFGVNDREKTTVNVRGRLAHVNRLLGRALLSDLNEREIRRYIQTRLNEKVSGRTVNMEVGELSRAIGKHWTILWPKVRKLEERTDVGVALSSEDESKLLQALGATKSQLVQTFIRTALLTGMRYSEILRLTWGQVDMERRVVTVGRSKTNAGTNRQIPMNTDLVHLLNIHQAWWIERFGKALPGLYLFPYGSPKPVDPTRPATTLKTGWESVRRHAGVKCRFHDLRHTVATKMAEAGVPESTMLALLGHMSRAMLERYSHIRMAAKREAVESLNAASIPAGPPTKVPTLAASLPLN